MSRYLSLDDSIIGEIDTPKGFNIYISQIRELTSGRFYCIFDNAEYIPWLFDIIENYIESTGDKDTRFIIINPNKIPETIFQQTVVTFTVNPFSFKEFVEIQWKTIELMALKNNPSIINNFTPLVDEYVRMGGYPDVVFAGNEEREQILQKIFQDIKYSLLSNIKTRDHAIFLSFLQVLANQTGELLKIDRLSQITDIPRRTIERFLEILENEWVIFIVFPFVKNKEKETSVHKKFYFSDLGYLRTLLGPYAFQGADRQHIYENFVFLELYRNLVPAHTIYFYRKKSQAEITFILENNTTQQLTPIDVIERSTEAIPQAFTSFDSDYWNSVNRYVVFNINKLTDKELGTKKVYILPHIAV